jgi:hypothetical protein
MTRTLSRHPAKIAAPVQFDQEVAGAIATMSGAYQSGMTTMQRLRSGGTQRVIVQHVSVSGSIADGR